MSYCKDFRKKFARTIFVISEVRQLLGDVGAAIS